MDLGLYVGTAGTSVWSSRIGKTWARPIDVGLYAECRVFSLTSQPADGSRVLAGTDQGSTAGTPSRNAGSICRRCSMNFKSGRSCSRRTIRTSSWRARAPPRCSDLRTPARAGSDWPSNFPRTAEQWNAARHANSVRSARSAVDLGRRGDRRHPSVAGRRQDVAQTSRRPRLRRHPRPGSRAPNGQRKLFATTNKGLHVSHDDGEHWQFLELDSPWQYTRTIVERADGRGVLFLSNGNGPPGSTGRLLRSTDYGETWKDVGLPGELNSTLWCVAVHPLDSQLVFACTNYGQLYLSKDGGDSWSKLPREFGEVRALLIRPLPSH